MEQPAVHELVGEVAELLRRDVAGDAVDAEPVVAELEHLAAAGAAEHFGHVGHAEPRAGAMDGGEDLLGDLGAVELREVRVGIETVVAVAAVVPALRGRLAEVVEQVAAAAGAQLAVPEHPAQPGERPFLFVRVLDLPDELLLGAPVGGGVEEDAVARLAVPAGAPGLLVVALEGLGQVVVDDEPDVRDVNPHPEGDRRHDDGGRLAREPFVGVAPNVVFEPRVVRQGFDPGVPQGGRHVLGLPAGEAVHDGGLAGLLAEHGDQHRQRTPLRADRVADVRAVEARDQELGVVHPEAFRDVGADARGGGGGQRHEGDLGQVLAERPEGQVVGPELVPPLRDAVRLVHGDEANAETARGSPGSRAARSARAPRRAA